MGDEVFDADDFSGFEGRLDSFREFDKRRENFFTNILQQYLEICRKYEQKCMDFEHEETSRREYQRKWTDSQKELTIIRNSINSKPFVVALIDGDGAPFVDELLQSGIDGGEKAAIRLQTEIKHYIEGLYSNSAGADWSIVVQIFANLDGMARKLYACGKITDTQHFLRLIREFNSTQPLFSFVDVGQGKERADNRMRETFRLFYGNPQCKHILFGGCHDTVYDLTLRQHKHDTVAASRISLLETIPAHQIYREYHDFHMTSFPSVFRADPLPQKPPPQIPIFNSPVAVPIAPTPKPSIPVQFPVISPAPTISTVPTPKPKPPPSTSSESPPVTTAIPNTGSYNPPTWATVGKNGAAKNGAAQNKMVAPTKSSPSHKRFLLLTEGDYRIDPPLPNVPKADAQALFERIKGSKLCNEYFLKGSCNMGERCPFSHEGKLPHNQLIALSHRARTIACNSGSYCRIFDCFLGHHCLMDDCGRQNCRFADYHNMDKHVTHKFFEDGTYEDFKDAQPYHTTRTH